MILQVSVTETTSETVDGHSITVAHWSGTFGDQSFGNGSVINEGPLSGLLNEVTRSVTIGMGEGNYHSSKTSESKGYFILQLSHLTKIRLLYSMQS